MLDDVDSNEYTNTLLNNFPSWGDNYSGAAYEDFGGWGATRGLIKDWRWLARLVDKHTHRGLVYTPGLIKDWCWLARLVEKHTH